VATNDYVSVLEKKLAELRGDIYERQSRIRILNSELEECQRLAEHLVELLKAENVPIDGGAIPGTSGDSIADIAHGELLAGDRGHTWHYKDLADYLMKKGIVIPGKDPTANLLTHISRDSRFVRVAPGTYGLSEWGLKPAKRKKARRLRRPRSS
jgi:hypothetical protein